MICDYIFDSNVSISGWAVHVLPKNNLENPCTKSNRASTSIWHQVPYFKGSCKIVLAIIMCQRDTSNHRNETHIGFFETILSFGDPGSFCGISKYLPPHHNPTFSFIFWTCVGVFSYAPFQLSKNLSFSCKIHGTSTHDTCSKTTKPKPRGFPVNLSIMTSLSRHRCSWTRDMNEFPKMLHEDWNI